MFSVRNGSGGNWQEALHQPGSILHANIMKILLIFLKNIRGSPVEKRPKTEKLTTLSEKKEEEKVTCDT